jgi:hypothetical protein
LEGSFSLHEVLLIEVAIADVVVGQEKKLVFGDLEDRFLSKGDYFGPVAFDDLRRASTFSLLLAYRLVCIVQFALFDFFRRESRYYLYGIMPCWL